MVQITCDSVTLSLHNRTIKLALIRVLALRYKIVVIKIRIIGFDTFFGQFSKLLSHSSVFNMVRSSIVQLSLWEHSHSHGHALLAPDHRTQLCRKFGIRRTCCEKRCSDSNNNHPIVSQFHHLNIYWINLISFYLFVIIIFMTALHCLTREIASYKTALCYSLHNNWSLLFLCNYYYTMYTWLLTVIIDYYSFRHGTKSSCDFPCSAISLFDQYFFFYYFRSRQFNLLIITKAESCVTNKKYGEVSKIK